MAAERAPDAVVVGSGPNGLAAAIAVARAGRSVLVLEAQDTIGGGLRSAELTLPGYLHDVCSAVHPLGLGSPFFRTLPLQAHGLSWIQPPIPFAHPLDDGTAVVLERSIDRTAAGFHDDRDALVYRRLMGPIARDARKIVRDALGPLRPPRHPLALARFGLPALLPATVFGRRFFRGERARALFAGAAAHSIQALDQPATTAFGLVMGMLGHAVGWPMPRGGSQRFADALVSYLRTLGGDVQAGRPVTSMGDIPDARAVLFDITPRQLLGVDGVAFPTGYARKLRGYRYGPGVFKLDWALDGPIPWRAPECQLAGTVHLGGTLDEIAAGEKATAHGEHPTSPYVLLVQQTLFDPTRAPRGKHTVWAYCHVPNGSTVDMTDRVEAQIERFAPGFKARVLARHAMGPADMERHNWNYVGGDINGGVQDVRQLFTRPMARVRPYATPDPRLFICSSSTPPGGGVHGMCGYHAARAALDGALRS